MELNIYEDAVSLAEDLSRELILALEANLRLLICVPSGKTPELLYSKLAESARLQPGLFSQIRVIALDEWGGLTSQVPQSCAWQILRQVVEPLAISSDRYFVWQGDSADPESECERAANWISDQGGIDLCILGLGTNGHVGLNEPDSTLQAGAHVAVLSAETAGHPMLQCCPTVPSTGLTLGLAEILQARQIRLLVTGRAKREILARVLTSNVDSRLPASFLKLHADVKIYATEDAIVSNSP